jgi:hypothetical protein
VYSNDQSQNAVAVAKIFESTKLFEDRFGRLLPVFDQVGRLSNEAVVALESIKALANHLEQLAGALEPVKGLQDQLAELARSFDSVSSLQGRFAEVSNAFRDHFKHLVSALRRRRCALRYVLVSCASLRSKGATRQVFP